MRKLSKKSSPSDGPAFLSPVDFGHPICGDFDAAEQREWLVTNGLGGYASGTVAGTLTRRYHGLLVAALRPFLARTLLVARLDETAEYAGETFPLSANRWASGAVEPDGCKNMERFRLEGASPVWTFALADALLEKRVWMQQGANTTYVEYQLRRARHPLRLAIKALVNYRDYHATTHADDWPMSVQPVPKGLRVLPYDGATPFYLLSDAAVAEPAHTWYRDYDLPVERFRGFDSREDHLHAGTFHASLSSGDSIVFAASVDPSPSLDGRSSWEANVARERVLLQRAARTLPHPPAWVQQLVLAAGPFIVDGVLPDGSPVPSVIAGYHWFGEWGRDTMIALPGLTLSTGRTEIAARILRKFARCVDRGMLPNRFSEGGGAPEFNTADASLWFFEAVRQTYEATRDRALLGELFPVLREIVDWHVRGTRYNIHRDPADGLLFAGQPGFQLTWMDAKVGDWVVTPRLGKPVEVNALWLNALVALGGFARTLRKPAAEYESMAKRAREGFKRFWNPAAGYCFDVLDGPEGNDPTLRPNQIFAVSLPETALSPAQQRAVLEVCARHLLTPYGLRSLAPSDPRYQGRYGGDPRQRDAAYHQGTVWGWLLGPFVLAHLRLYRDPPRAASYLESLPGLLETYGLGSVGEIFDGDAPFTPRGCIAQAWSVAEILRAWQAIAAHR